MRYPQANLTQIMTDESRRPEPDTPEITIPEIEIGPNWFVAELASIQECDDALAYLTEAIATIERQLAMDGVDRPSRGARWRSGATASLRFKKHAVEVVTRKRAVFASVERRAWAWLGRNEPDVVKRAIEAVGGAEAP